MIIIEHIKMMQLPYVDISGQSADASSWTSASDE